MPTPTENINDADISAATWLQSDKVDAGSTLAESDTPTYAAAVWANGMDNMVVQTNEVFNGARIINSLHSTALQVNNATGTAHANGDDLVIGSTGGAGAAYGMTLYTDTTGTGNVYFADSTSSTAALFRYTHSSPAFQWHMEGSFELQLTNSALSPGSDAGLSLGTTSVRYANLYSDAGTFTDSLEVNNANGTATAAADDFVIGNNSGIGQSYGMTIFSDSTGICSVKMGDADSATVGGWAYNHSSDAHFWSVAGADEMILTASNLRPNVDAGLNLGATGQRWATTYSDAVVVTDTLQVNNAAGTASATADDLVIGTTGDADFHGITIFAPSTSIGRVCIGDESSGTVGQWLYAHSTNTHSWVVNGTTELSLSNLNLYPQTDAGLSLGATGARWATTYTDDLVVTTSITWDAAPTYTPSNVTTDRTFDANSTTLDEVADVLGTLIADLQTLGVLA